MPNSLPPKNHNAPKRSIVGEWYFQRDEWMRSLTENTDLTNFQRLVGVHLALRINRGSRVALHQQSTLATQLGVSEHAIKMAIRKLREEKLVKVDKGRRGVKNRNVNTYSLIYPWEIV